MLARRSDLDGFRQKDVRAEVWLVSEAIRQARLDEADAQGRIADGNTILEDQNPDELRRRKMTLTELGGKIRAAQDAIDAEQKLVEEQDAAIARLTKRLEAARTPELAALRQRSGCSVNGRTRLAR